MMLENISVLFSLLHSVLCGSEVKDETKKIITENFEEIYKLSKEHDVAHFVSYIVAQNKIELPQTESAVKFKRRHPIAVIRYEALNVAYKQLCSILEDEKIPFIPLKGAVIRNLYPEPWMRTSCDIDILVHESDLDKVSDMLVNNFGYERNVSGTHDISFDSPNGIHVEMHFCLHDSKYESIDTKILENVWDYAVLKDDTQYQYVLMDEFLYMFHIYHMAKHFEYGGCGIRPFVDLWLLDNNVAHDDKKRDELLEQCGLLAFANCCRTLSRHWLENGEINEVVLRMQNYVLDGGVYGSLSNRFSVNMLKEGNNKVKHILRRMFLPYEIMKEKYPIIEKHKWLLPFFQIGRWFKLLDPRRRAVAKKHFKVISNINSNNPHEVGILLEDIGLKQHDDMS